MHPTRDGGAAEGPTADTRVHIHVEAGSRQGSREVIANSIAAGAANGCRLRPAICWRSAYARWALNTAAGADAGTGVGGLSSIQLSTRIATSAKSPTMPAIRPWRTCVPTQAPPILLSVAGQVNAAPHRFDVVEKITLLELQTTQRLRLLCASWCTMKSSAVRL